MPSYYEYLHTRQLREDYPWEVDEPLPPDPSIKMSHRRLFAYGGGIQSTALMILQAQGKLDKPFDSFVMMNVGNEAENPDTIKYLREVAQPYAKKHGIEIIECFLTDENKWFETKDLYKKLIGDGKSVPIPVYMQGGAPGHRSCTVDFKIRPINRYLRYNIFATHATVGLGITIDELTRMKDEEWTDREPSKNGKGRKYGFWRRSTHPLVDLGLSRDDCVQIILDAGLPLPPKSSCWFCPFKSRIEWIDMRINHPALFAKAVELEKRINEKRTGSDIVYLHRDRKPLEEAVPTEFPPMQIPLFMMQGGSCGVGHCGR